MATENGWKAPSWALPPREVDVANLTVDTKKLREQLQKGLEHIYEMEDPADRQIGFYNPRGGPDQEKKMWNACSDLVFGTASRERSQKPEPDLGERLSLRQKRSHQQSKVPAVRCGHDVGSRPRHRQDGCSCIGLPRPRLTGKKFVGQLECVKGNVLVIQKDESDGNLAAKDAKMNVDDPEDRIRCRFEFDPDPSEGHRQVD